MSYEGFESDEETLTCAICNQLLREPKLLPCLHSICALCTGSIFNGYRKNIYCPICSEECFVTDCESLPLNYWLKNVIATINITKFSEGKLCSFCEFLDERNEAIAKCLTCGDLLCKLCWEHRHTYTTQTRDHQVVSIEDIKSGKYYEEIRLQQNIMCPDHKKEFFRYYCNTCNELACKDCMVLQHAKHDFITPKEARTQTEKDLESTFSEVNEKLFSLKSQYSEMSKTSKEIKENEKILRIKIETTCNSMINKITARRRSLERELTKAFKPTKSIIERESESIENRANSLENSVTFCKNLLKYGTDLEILSLQRVIKDRLSKISLTKDYPPVQDCMDVMPSLVASWNGPNMELIYDTKISKEKPDFSKSNSECTKDKMENEIRNISQITKISFNETSDKGTQCDLMQTTMESDFLERTFLKYRSLLVHNNYQRPKLTSIAWIDGESFVAVDQHNGTIQSCPLSGGSGIMGLLTNCVAVTVTSWCIAVKTSSSAIELLDHNLSYKYTIGSASVVSACSPRSHFLALISRSRITIVKSESEQIQCIKFTDKCGNSLKLGQPRFACLLSDGKFAISDWEKDFVYLFDETGQVSREEFCYPGAITSDTNDHIYIADFYEHIINVIDFKGSTRRTIHLSPHLSHPRSISINIDNKLAVAFENQVALFQLKAISSHHEEETRDNQSC
ncbi:E3 ubiquitin-protein ligase TRIM56-like [Saccostrea echinata]|uniref:E3 ubiquitin-protein ligase TRIM56-like n=1 Tax=Saccostrea echinata TaxID=191078 RepID=UPI002A834697|nr:E3 ubiquitin-protein ligase TRIM56-like [Saccostrea echinata]